jgi:hypothetical protein
MPATYICSHCGQQHDGLPTDWAFKLPDEVHELNYLDRYARTRHNGDLCTLDEARFFFRALLPIRLLEGDFFNWGVWVEVDKATHDLYVRSWEEDISSSPRVRGHLANHIKVHVGSIGLPVDIEFRPGTDRPNVWLPPEVTHSLAVEQRNGISGKRHHDILAAVGHFGDEGPA